GLEGLRRRCSRRAGHEYGIVQRSARRAWHRTDATPEPARSRGQQTRASRAAANRSEDRSLQRAQLQRLLHGPEYDVSTDLGRRRLRARRWRDADGVSGAVEHPTRPPVADWRERDLVVRVSSRADRETAIIGAVDEWRARS